MSIIHRDNIYYQKLKNKIQIAGPYSGSTQKIPRDESQETPTNSPFFCWVNNLSQNPRRKQLMELAFF